MYISTCESAMLQILVSLGMNAPLKEIFPTQPLMITLTPLTSQQFNEFLTNACSRLLKLFQCQNTTDVTNMYVGLLNYYILEEKYLLLYWERFSSFYRVLFFVIRSKRPNYRRCTLKCKKPTAWDNWSWRNLQTSINSWVDFTLLLHSLSFLWGFGAEFGV